MVSPQESLSSSSDQACDGLSASVQWYLRKKIKKKKSAEELNAIEKKVQRVLCHARYLLGQLLAKRQSLLHGISELSKCWKDDYLEHLLKQSAEKKPSSWLLPVLSAFFQHYIRLRDGTVLLTSGECRHVGDAAAAKRTKFKSRLQTLSKESDGYTLLYSAPKGYSGFGWDEFFQEAVGVKIRLLNLLGGDSKIWDNYLLDHGAQVFESCLDEHESIMSSAKDELEALRKVFCADLTRVLDQRGGGSVQMVTLDKMERLHVAVHSHKSHLKLERLADNFQVPDKRGVLPNGWTTKEWKRVLALPKVESKSNPMQKSSTKRKRVIVESDESEEDETENETKKNTKASKATDGGLKVQISRKSEDKLSRHASLDTIKKNLGVNATDLEAAREVVEKEEEQTKTYSMNARAGLVHDIASSRRQVKRLRRILQTAIGKDDDDYEVWDARECLRESIMTLGSQLLSLPEITNNTISSTGSNLKEAEDSFREALSLVDEQIASHTHHSIDTNDNSRESCRISRVLLLLKGRAYTNIGISLLEQGHRQRNKSTKNFFQKGRKEINKGVSYARKLRQSAIEEEGKRATMGAPDYKIERLQADQLESLSLRWIATSFWREGRTEDATNAVDMAADLFLSQDFDSMEKDSEVHRSTILLGVESFYAPTSLADFASEALETVPPRQCPEKGAKFLSLACRCYKLAADISSKIWTLTLRANCDSSFEDLKVEHGVMSSDDVSQIVDELKRWWKLKTESTTAGVSVSLQERKQDVPRRELFDERSHQPTSAPRRRFVVGRATKTAYKMGAGGTATNRSSKSTSNRSGGNNYTATFFQPTDDSEMTDSQVQFQKWGDELLCKEDGSPYSFPYPACAPTRPRQ